MIITVCEMRDASEDFAQDWEALVAHVEEAKSDVVLLPEMPFAPWMMWADEYSAEVWRSAVEAHDVWIGRLEALAPSVVLGSRVLTESGRRYNEGFVWDAARGYQRAHRKYYLPDEAGFWEASWYQRGEKDYQVMQSGAAKIGFQMCTELWFTEHSRQLARQGVHLLVSPRATELATVDKWIAGGRAAAVMSGAYCLSSNRSGLDEHDIEWGGNGWIIDPDGMVLGLTSQERPFLSLEVELERAERAKTTYPRYVRE